MKILAFTLILFCAFSTNSVASCCCVGLPTLPKDKLKAADVVVVAELIAIKPIEFDIRLSKRRVKKATVNKCTFKVYTVYKGTINSRIIDIYNPDVYDCGALFEKGMRYIIYATRSQQDELTGFAASEFFLHTNYCKRNARINDNEITAIEQEVTALKRWLN